MTNATVGPEKTKRRFRFLFRRDSKPQKAVEKEGPPMPYQFPALTDMSPEQIEQEIKLRFRSLQRLGKIECTDLSVIQTTEPEDSKQSPQADRSRPAQQQATIVDVTSLIPEKPVLRPKRQDTPTRYLFRRRPAGV